MSFCVLDVVNLILKQQSRFEHPWDGRQAVSELQRLAHPGYLKECTIITLPPPCMSDPAFSSMASLTLHMRLGKIVKRFLQPS